MLKTVVRLPGPVLAGAQPFLAARHMTSLRKRRGREEREVRDVDRRTGDLAVVACTQGRSDNPPQAATKPGVAAPLATDPGDRVALFGDLHLHTSYSMDVAASRTETLPADACRYAMGEPIQYLGKTIRRRAPLDFLANRNSYGEPAALSFSQLFYAGPDGEARVRTALARLRSGSERADQTGDRFL